GAGDRPVVRTPPPQNLGGSRVETRGNGDSRIVVVLSVASPQAAGSPPAIRVEATMILPMLAEMADEGNGTSPRAVEAVAASALEQGMQQFLDQLDRLGQPLAAHPDGTGLGPWIVAGAASAVACEIARRHLKRSAEVPPSLEVSL